MNITPLDIKKKLESTPLLQREEVAKSYVGIEINNWAGRANKMTEFRDSVSAFLDVDDGSYLAISFTFKLSDHPEFKWLKPGQDALIKKAKIRDVARNIVHLSDCEVRFDFLEKEDIKTKLELVYQKTFNDYRHKEEEFFKTSRSMGHDIAAKQKDMIDAWKKVDEVIKKLINK